MQRDALSKRQEVMWLPRCGGTRWSRRSPGWKEGLQAVLNLDSTSLFRFTDPGSAAELQEGLAPLVSEETPHGFYPRLVCGVDASYSNGTGIGVAVIWDLEKSLVVEVQSVEGKVHIDYFPGFFGFREGPLVLAAVGNLTVAPDAFLVDGHGRSHPRRFGLACHVGLALAKPTIGVAKSIYYGRRSGAELIGSDGSVLARVLNRNVKRSCYVSIGHLVGLEDALALVERCVKDGRVVPLGVAHHEAVRLARRGRC